MRSLKIEVGGGEVITVDLTNDGKLIVGSHLHLEKLTKVALSRIELRYWCTFVELQDSLATK